MAFAVHSLDHHHERTSLGAHWTALVILSVLVLVLYLDSWDSMKRIWDVPAYNHGYLIPLIAGWLVWRQRDILARSNPATGLSALAGLALCGLLWSAGDLAGVNAARHFAIVGMVTLVVPLVFGWHIARTIAFPLGFLFFAVPFGDFLLPWMMEATAQVTIFLVGLTGVPIHQQGLSFVLPSGSWEIIEECSGLRYLITALPLAALYAWLSFRRHSTRWLFVLTAAAIAVLANWIRAWGIVMVGHWSGMSLATGIDHLIYGWGFFGVVMGLLFWIGSRWTETPRPEIVSRAEAGASGRVCSKGRLAAVTLAGALLTICWPWLSSFLTSRVSADLDLAALSAQARGASWTVGRDASPEARLYSPEYQGARQEIHLYDPARGVRAWVGSYEDQRDQGEMIQHANAVKSRRVHGWNFTAEQRTAPEAFGATLQATEYALANVSGRWLVWRSYLIDGRYTNSDVKAKLMTAWRVALGRGDRSIVVLLWAPLDDSKAGTESLARDRLGSMLAQLAPVLAQADQRR